MDGYPSVLVGSVSVCHFKLMNRLTHGPGGEKPPTIWAFARFHLCIEKWGLIPFSHCECGALDKLEITFYQGAQGQIILDKKEIVVAWYIANNI